MFESRMKRGMTPSKNMMTPLKTPSKFKSASKDSLQVFCRLRPMSSPNDTSCIEVISDSAIRLTLPESSVNFRSGVYKETIHSFKRVFTEAADQKTVFQDVAYPLVEQLLRGRNGLLFTYGVTGSGKTYTMNGTPQDGGIMPRCLDVIFNTISEYQTKKHVFKPDRMNGFEVQSEDDAARERGDSLKNAAIRNRLKKKDSEEDLVAQRSKDDSKISTIDEDNSYALFISYIEVYNNSVYDLLEGSFDLDVSAKMQSKIIREDASRNMYVHGVTEIEVKDAGEAYEVFYRGQKRKRMAHTTLNTESSRSHSVFNIRLVQAPLDIDGERVIQDKAVVAISQLSLVDLAGSERTNRTKNSGQRLREAGNINNSLLTLRSCLEILRENQMTNAGKMLPYRDSKLTHLFKNYFDGEGDIRMIVCVNPRTDDYDETVQIMKFSEVSQDVQVSKPTPVKIDLGLTPGRRKANQALKKAMQILEEDNVPKRGPTVHIPNDPTIIFSLGPFPNLDLNDVEDVDTHKTLMSYLEERSKKMDELRENIQSKTNRFRSALVNVENDNMTLRQENVTYKAMLDHERNRTKTLENRLVTIDSSQSSLKRKLVEVETENKRLKRENAQKDVEITLKSVEKEKEKKKYNAKIAMKTELLAKEMEQKAREKRNVEMLLRDKEHKLRRVKRILREDNGTSEAVLLPSKSVEVLCDIDDHSTETTSSYTPPAAVPTKSVTATPSNIYSIPISNPRRRSHSECNENWLDHRPKTTVALNTVLQPILKKRKSVTKLVDPKEVSKTSKYCLTTQHQDEQGEIETHLFKGNVVPTVGGGAQIIFNDVETLKQTSPLTSPLTSPTRKYNNEPSDSSPRRPSLYPDISGRCAVSVEGHSNAGKK